MKKPSCNVFSFLFNAVPLKAEKQDCVVNYCVFWWVENTCFNGNYSACLERGSGVSQARPSAPKDGRRELPWTDLQRVSTGLPRFRPASVRTQLHSLNSYPFKRDSNQSRRVGAFNRVFYQEHDSLPLGISLLNRGRLAAQVGQEGLPQLALARAYSPNRLSS